MTMVDWGAAQRIGEMVAGSPPYGDLRVESVQPLAHDFAQRVSAYSGLEPAGELPALEMVDRPKWIAANLQTARPLLEMAQNANESRDLRATRLGQRLGGLIQGASLGRTPLSEHWDRHLAPAMRSTSALMLGAQIGGIFGMFSQRVLGQYDVALLDDSVTPRLLLVAPNLAQLSSKLKVDREELVSWVTIHELTHAIQFTGAPWLRGYLAGLLGEMIKGLGERTFTASTELVRRLREGEVMRAMVGEELWPLLQRIQAAMTLIEGHAEHVMDVVGADVLSSLPALRTAMTQRRDTHGLGWRIFGRLLGFDAKMAQYEEGHIFCDLVVKQGGPQALARAWSSPQALPSVAEIASPELWLARTA
jgi:coenzyme F420 biosynthesis associated uncharacterized protein